MKPFHLSLLLFLAALLKTCVVRHCHDGRRRFFCSPGPIDFFQRLVAVLLVLGSKGLRRFASRQGPIMHDCFPVLLNTKRHLPLQIVELIVIVKFTHFLSYITRFSSTAVRFRSALQVELWLGELLCSDSCGNQTSNLSFSQSPSNGVRLLVADAVFFAISWRTHALNCSNFTIILLITSVIGGPPL